MKLKLLTRREFRESVFNRDKNKCIVCKNPAVDAHHILDRKLFPDGGYYIENGVSVCESCHIKAEQSIISCNELRKLAGIKNIILPPQLANNFIYDKWGNAIF